MSRGQIYNLKVRAAVGPWSDASKHHPGLVMARPGGSEDPCVVLPITSSVPRVPLTTYAVKLEDRVGDLDPPMWIRCDCPVTIAGTELTRATRRGALSGGPLERVKNRLGFLFGLSPFDT